MAIACTKIEVSSYSGVSALGKNGQCGVAQFCLKKFVI